MIKTDKILLNTALCKHIDYFFCNQDLHVVAWLLYKGQVWQVWQLARQTSKQVVSKCLIQAILKFSRFTCSSVTFGFLWNKFGFNKVSRSDNSLIQVKKVNFKIAWFNLMWHTKEIEQNLPHEFCTLTLRFQKGIRNTCRILKTSLQALGAWIL